MTDIKKMNRRLTRHTMKANNVSEFSLKAKLDLVVSKALPSERRLVSTARIEDVSSSVATLAPVESFSVHPPTTHGETRTPILGEIGELRAHLVSNATVSAYSSSVVVGDQLALPDHYIRNDRAKLSDPWFLVWHGRDGKALVDFGTRRREFDRGIALIGAGAYNWYHWLIERLPIVFLADRLPEKYNNYPFIVPEELLELSTFRESLDLFTGNREVVPIGIEACNFNSLILCDSPIIEPINMSFGDWLSPKDYSFNSTIMREYRDETIRRLGIDRGRAPRRIFLARRHGRRSYNQDDIIAISTRYGLETVDPARLSFRDQVQLMHDAEVIVGPSGAAFATTLFCQPGTQLLSWLIPEYRGFCSYTNLASITNSEIHYLFTPTAQPVQSTHHAFSVTYELDPEAFEDSLVKTIALARTSR